MENYYDKAGYKDCDLGNWKHKGNRKRLHVPSGSHDNVANNLGKKSMEAMMANLLKRVDSTDASVKEMVSDLSTKSQLVDSYSTSIKPL